MFGRLLRLVFLFVFSVSLVAGETYTVPVLGDLHFDRMEYHDFEGKFSDFKKNTGEINRYVKATADDTPQLLAAVARKVDRSTPFVLQLGDFTQGDCGSQALQEAMFDGGLALVKEKINVPFLTTKGNHDIRGPGAKAAYDSRILPFLSRELGREINSANYIVTHGRDAYLFFDCMKPDLAWLEAALKEHQNARHLFVVTHYPVLPVSQSEGILFGRDEIQRKRLLNLLLEHNVVVLCGHLHRLVLAEYAASGGRIIQLMAFSVTNAAASPFRDELSLADYGPQMVDPKDQDQQRLERRQRLLTEYREGMKRFFFTQGSGYVVLRVGPEKIVAEFYSGPADRPTKVLAVK